MSTHLSDEQIAKYLTGEESAGMEAHIAACDSCRNEARRLLDVVGTMKAHVERASENHLSFWTRQRFAIRETLSTQRPRRRTWALVGALALLVFTSTFLFQGKSTLPQEIAGEKTSLSATISDEALLAAVDSALEKDVPAALAPLQKLAVEREQAERNGTSIN